jgi:stage II sporulation protein R
MRNRKALLGGFGMNNSSKILKICCACFAAVLLIGLIQLNSYTKDISNGLADNLIRLHVIANSDSPEDQELKRDVRDAVLSYVRGEVKDSSDIEQTRGIILNSMEEITSVAQKAIYDKGKDYEVKTILGSHPFPTKAYGDIYLPAGNYQALRVVIGNGEGANWWCVLFPPLCFVDVTHGTVPETVKDDLKKVLSEEEYNIITSSEDESDIPIKIKFKIVEMLQESRIKLAGVIERVFGSEG